MIQHSEIHAAIPAQEEFLLALSVVRDLAVDQGTALRALAEATAVYADLIAARSEYKQNALGNAQIHVMCLVHASESFEALAESQIQLASSMAKSFEPANKLVSRYFHDLAQAEKILETRTELERKRVEGQYARGTVAEARQALLKLKTDHLMTFSPRLAEVDLMLTRSSTGAATRLYANLSDAMHKAKAAHGLAGLEKWQVFLSDTALAKQDRRRSTPVQGFSREDEDRDQVTSLMQLVDADRKAAADLPITRWRSSIVGHLERIASDESTKRDTESKISTLDLTVKSGAERQVAPIGPPSIAVQSAVALVKDADVDTLSSRAEKRRTMIRNSRMEAASLPNIDDSPVAPPSEEPGEVQSQPAGSDDIVSGPSAVDTLTVVDPTPDAKRSSAVSMSVMSFLQQHGSQDPTEAMGSAAPRSMHPPAVTPMPVYAKQALPKFGRHSRQAQSMNSMQPEVSEASDWNAQHPPTPSKHRLRLSKLPRGLKLYKLFTKSNARPPKNRRDSIFSRKAPHRPPRPVDLDSASFMTNTQQEHEDRDSAALDGLLSYQSMQKQALPSKPQTAHGVASRRISILPLCPPRPASAAPAAVSTSSEEEHGETQWVTKKIVKKQDATLRTFSSMTLKHSQSFKVQGRDRANDVASLDDERNQKAGVTTSADTMGTKLGVQKQKKEDALEASTAATSTI